MPLPHLVFMIVIAFLWGFAPIVMKVAFESVPPLIFTSVRFVIVALLLMPFLRWHKGKMPLIIAIASTVGWLEFSLFFTGLAISGDVAPVAVAAQLSVPFATILSIVILGEIVRWRRWTGILLSFGGVMLFSFDPHVMAYLPGLTFAIGGALSHAMAMVLMRRIDGIGVFEMQAWVASVSAPVLLVLSLVFETNQMGAFQGASWGVWLTLFYGAFLSSLVAHAGFYWMVQRYEVTILAPFTLLAPIFTILFGFLLLGDQLTTRMIVGSAIALIGVAIVTLRTDDLRESDPLP